MLPKPMQSCPVVSVVSIPRLHKLLTLNGTMCKLESFKSVSEFPRQPGLYRVLMLQYNLEIGCLQCTPTRYCIPCFIVQLKKFIIMNFICSKHKQVKMSKIVFIEFCFKLEDLAKFQMFIINGYYMKSKCFQSLDSLLKNVIIYCCVFFGQIGNTVDETVQQ